MSEELKTLQNALSASLASSNEDGNDPLSTGPINYPTESRIESIILSKKNEAGEEITFSLFPWNPTVSVTSPFRGFTFKESIYSGCMFGSLFVSDLKNWIDEFQFTGIEKLELKMKIGQSGETVTFKFHVYDSKLVSNDADTSQTNPSDERSSFWKIDVVSSEIFLPHYYNTFLETNEDFIGNLSENYDGSVQPTVGDENEFFEQENQTKKENLVNAIFDKFKFPVGRIDSSRTGVWLKSDHVAYPWMKRKGQMRVSQLLKYLANYAWDGNTSKYSCDYYWWEDRNGWNFRSLSKMISTEDGSKLKEPVEGFIVSVDETNPNRLIEIEVINEYNILNLLSSGALTSYYKRHDPNYNNVYLDFTDSSESIKVQNLTYDYHERYNDITQIGNYKLIADSFDTNPFLENGNPKEAVRFDDEIYGYFNSNFLNTPYGQQWETYGKTASTPWSKVAWQPQFDLTDLSFETFKVIHKDIRIPLKKKREEYARKKNIKRKWETYRCTICCHENGAIGSTKDIELFNNPGAVDGYTYNALFGPTGMFSNVNEEYKLVAAGSFTDLINYDAGNTFYERGLTYSYDLTKEPYNQTIGQFFNITGPTVPTAYSEFVINRSLRLYNIFIQKMEDRITDLEDFVTNRCKTYKQTADDIFTSVLLNKESNTIRSIDLTQGFRYVGDAIVGEKITDWPSTEVEYGILPHSSIPQDKGVGQVVFGDPPPEQRSITFRSLELPENGNQNQGDGGVAQECYTLPGFESSCCDCCIAQCTGQSVPQSCNPVGQGGGCSPLCDCPEVTKYCCNPDSPAGCITLIYNPLAPGSSPTECSQVGGQESSSCSACTDPDGSLGACWTTDGCYNAPESECQGVYLGPGTPCTPVPDNATIILIVGQGREGPQGPQGPTGPTGATGPTGPSGLPTEEDLRYVPYEAFQDCSQDPIIRGFIKYKTETSRDNYSPIYLYAAPYLWDDDTIKDWSYFDYGSESGLIPAISSSSTRKETRDCLEDSGPNGCYNTTCLSSVALEVLRRTCIGELELLKKEVELFKQIRDKISNEYISRWRNAYTEWHERNAFFFSKKPGKSIFRKEQPLTGDESDFFSADSNEPKINSPLSLQNIKTITRKEIRGSRYELLSRYEGITGASAAAWKYNIFLGGNSGSTGHPYYDQKYNSKKFITSREPHKWFVINNSNDTDDLGADFEYPARYRDQRGFGDYGPQYGVGAESEQNSAFHLGLNEWVNISQQGTYDSYGYAQSDLNTSTVPIDLYKDTFNFYDLENKKPPNIKKEEISSYVRVEFRNPIGLDTVSNFPNGFVRDAGTEYFLPYIVNLTVGPIGKQSVKYNAAVIGMDPYGFDVAVKKIKDDIPINRRLQGIDKGNYYKWWNHDTGSVLSKTEYLSTDYNGMDLWPEIGFETEFPYYAYDPMQEDMHGGGYDLDFHNGGGYYFENESQDWMESLYHYGMSSGKQFDPLYRSSVVGSYILPNSYRKLKPHRSWWSLFVPRNLFIPIRFANILQTPNTKARSTFGTRGVFSISSNYWKSWYGNEFENWLTLSPNSTNLLWSDTEISFYVDIGDVPGVAVPNATPQKSISTLTTNEQNSVQTYFNDSLMNYLGSNYTLYRPNLVETELWKWDLSGETEYGLITPPVDTEYEFFDRNFSIQFTVHARNKSLTCESIGLKCANPETIKNGPIVSAGGCTAAPYCNCPAQYNIPTEPEPTYLELYKLKNEISECSLISEKLDESWLGCNYSEPDSPGSCSCPEQGENYKYYLEYDRTYATFWETPLDLPLRRLAQTNQYDAQKIRIRIPPNGNVKIGDIVELINPNDTPDLTANEFKKISGRWMISEIGHNLINSFSYLMDLTLIRNSLQYDINKSQSPSSTFTTNT